MRPPTRRSTSRPCIAGYFDTLGVGLVRGRAFAAADRDGALPVAIVSEDVAARDVARREPDRPPPEDGHRRLERATGSPWWASRGPTRYRELAAQRPVLYVPAEQLIVAAQSIAVRSSAPLADTAAAIRAAVRAVDPAVQRDGGVAARGAAAGPDGAAALHRLADRHLCRAALFLSAVGVFAVTAGVGAPAASRAAGAHGARAPRPATCSGSCSEKGLRLALVGIAVGTAGAIAAAQSLRELLYEVAPIDPPSLAGAAALLLLSSLLACALPAWRAARVIRSPRCARSSDRSCSRGTVFSRPCSVASRDARPCTARAFRRRWRASGVRFRDGRSHDRTARRVARPIGRDSNGTRLDR